MHNGVNPVNGEQLGPKPGELETLDTVSYTYLLKGVAIRQLSVFRETRSVLDAQTGF